ncbi:MAG: peptidoglycan editing factor PgeF [Candidatus Edwardsbacteria bacterium]|nr:peptidoglycan editing factor PgeF [Candidatus Edwardsbacteria bacterium]MBU1576417.1 peptidoglycan editing factor PgeF [Candidatus Edwardsbacteria bacterium]MBU2463027.1 peptidoglycan editing factor PgeF [Candidatus Edwardsbacteria bacterium]MBU2593823.1 peptidoglycan editing factor PgeF [Candidatus Edwardsbacteria bacterium]
MVKYWQVTQRFGCDVLELNFLNEFGIKHGLVIKTQGRDIDEAGVYRSLSARHKTVVTSQVHGCDIRRVDSMFDKFYPHRVEADGLMTDRNDVVLTIHTADCLPVYLASSDRRCLALVHAGWKGTADKFAAKAVDVFCSEYGLSPKELVAAIGPGIEADCYQVGSEVAERFQPEHARADANGKWLLDLRNANRDQLLTAGMKPCNIYVSDFCTKCHSGMFHSYRREGKLKGKMIAFMEAPDD